LGVDDLFDGVFDIVDGQFIPKPQIEPFKVLIKKFAINPEETVFIDDIAKNLSVKKELNLKTVWLINNEYWGKQDSDKNYIDVKIENLTSFLKEINILKAA
jgi:putative hydrolase of the HAD superfamily